MAVAVLDVAAGVLKSADGKFLVAQRTKLGRYCGQWEFPGGKIEAGETSGQALLRELREELAINATEFRPLITLVHQYPEFCVRLHVFLVTKWTGKVESVEGQPLYWGALTDLKDMKMLAADAPIFSALELPSIYVFTPVEVSVDQINSRVQTFGSDYFVRLRLPALSMPDYEAFARQVIQGGHIERSKLILDRGVELSRKLGCGVHLPEYELIQSRNGLPDDLPHSIASIHGVNELKKAADIGVDALVIGAIKQTDSHPRQPGIGWEEFSRLVEQSSMPAYAIGGLSTEDLNQSWIHGAQGIAGISSFWR